MMTQLPQVRSSVTKTSQQLLEIVQRLLVICTSSRRATREVSCSTLGAVDDDDTAENYRGPKSKSSWLRFSHP